VATRDDKPEWLSPPAGVTTARVCGVSGKLATEGCEDVEVVTRDGEVRHQSMVYTEYFARGTEPTMYCDEHPTRGLLGTIAGVFGAVEKPAPPHSEDTRTPAPVGTAGTGGGGAPPAPELRKRGFWPTILGIGRESKDQ
jgi:hypothetical protein